MPDETINPVHFQPTAMNLMLAPEGLTWLPPSITGYLSLALSLFSLAAIAIGYGRWLEKLNGMGGRVRHLELESVAANAERAATTLSITRLIDQHDALIEKLGRHERSTEACREDTEKLGITLGGAINDNTREVARMSNELSNRITAVEVTLRERNRSENS